MQNWIAMNAGELQWLVDPEWREELFDAHGLRLPEWSHRGCLEVVKEAWHRSIFRVTLPGGSVYVKHYPLGDFRAHVRQIFRPSKARDEFECALGVAARKVSTVQPIAVGETPSGESYLVTRALEPNQPLSVFLEQTLPALPPEQREPLRFQTTEQLARFLAHMHEVGVVHPDLHAGNILVRWDGTRDIQLYLIDLHAVQLRRPLNWAQSRHNLVMLNRWFVQRSSRADRRRFWTTYFAHRRQWDVKRSELRDRARELEQLTWESCLEFWANRDARCLGNNRYFRKVRAGGNRAWTVRDLPREVIEPIVANPDILQRAPGFRVLKQSRSSVVSEVTLRIDQQPRTVIFKRFVSFKRRDPWLSLIRPTPALRSWINGFRLLNRGMPTARPLAIIHRRRFGMVIESFLITEKLNDAHDLHYWLDALSDRPPAARNGELHRLIEHLAKLIRELHERQLSHRDLKGSNILVRSPEGNGSPAFWLIDLAGVQRFRRLPFRKRVQNLARLNVSLVRHPWISRTDRLRFLRGYLRWGLRGKGGWKELWRQVAKMTQAKLAVNRQRNRPIS